MKYIGFLKEYDKNIRNAISRKDMFLASLPDNKNRERIIDYLDGGKVFGSSMIYLYDVDHSPIGGLTYLTDGIYAWPNYYPFYIRKYPNFEIASEFIEHVQKNNFTVPEIKDSDLDKIDYEFTMEWAGKY